MPARFDDQQSPGSLGDVNRVSYSHEVAIVERFVICQSLSLSALIGKRICKLGAKVLGISRGDGEG